MGVVASLLALTLGLAPQPQAAPLTSPFNLLVEPRGTLLVADGPSGRIVRVDPRTGRRSVYAKGLGAVHALAYGPDGLYATTGTQLIRFRGSTRQAIASGFDFPIGLAVAADRTVYVVESDRNRVVKLDGRTGKRTVVASAGLDQPLGAVLGSDGALLVADSHHGRIVKIGEDGALEPVLEGLALPIGLAPGPGGSVYVVDHVRHDARGKILLLRPDGTTAAVSSGKIKAVSAVAAGRGGLYATSFFAPFVGRVGAGGAFVPLGVR